MVSRLVHYQCPFSFIFKPTASLERTLSWCKNSHSPNPNLMRPTNLTSIHSHLLSSKLLHSPSKSVHLPNNHLFQTLDQCQSPSSLPTLESVHSKLHPVSDPSIAIKLMRAYSACGQPSLARNLFHQIPQKNIIFFNVMIRSYVNNHQYNNALHLFSQLCHSQMLRPDNYTYPCALKACSGCQNLPGGVQIHGAVTKIGLDSNLFVGNSLITMYSRCDGLSGSAYYVFEGMPVRDIVSWNAMVAGLAQSGQFGWAVEMCKELIEQGKPRPDAGTMASILPAMSKVSFDDVKLVRRIFDEMDSSNRNLISWNAMIAIYVNNSMAVEAVDLFSRMEVEGIDPDSVTLASVLPACGAVTALSLGKKIHDFIRRKKMCPNLVLENALMDMYANCGCLKDAREVFDKMEGRDVVSWTAIISAYGTNGHGEEAITLFEQMQESGLNPDHIAFVSIISACSYSGLLEQGKHFFKSMTDRYMMVPRIEHFACMVDLLGRAGLIEEAYNFIKQMPIEPNERVWGALLGACRVHSNTSIGLVAADCLFKLVPEQSGYYVLLSNIYARAGRWEDVSSVRSVMASKGIKKIPGCSNVEIGDKVHTFHIGDWSHPQSKKIYSELDFLMGKMKEVGYVAETEATLHDVEEEDKVGHLAMHSEKLAMAFAMINTRPGTPIRITMNLRMCGDCHRAAKFISNICKREIIIRDTNRFHHFERGFCSCGDYW